MRRALIVVSLAIAACPLPEYHYPPGPPDIEAFSATPFEVPPGGSTELSWRVVGATSVTLAGERVDNTGVKQLSFSADTLVELIAENEGGTSRARVQITIRDPQPAIIEDFSVAPPIASPGDAITVQWRTANATNVRLSLATGELLLDSAPPIGTYVHRSPFSFSIELRVEGFQGPKIETRTVDISELGPVIEELYVDPPIVTPPRTADLVWQVRRARELTVTELFDSGNEVLVYQGPVSAGNGRITLSSDGGSRTVRVVATSPGGTVSETTRMIVLEPRPPEILELSVTPAINGPGGSGLLRWATRYADDITLIVDSQLFTAEPEGQYWVSFARSEVIELTAIARSTLEMTTRSVDVTVDFARPEMHLFATPDTAALGEEVTIDWDVERADQIRFVTDSGELIATSTLSSGRFTYVAYTPVYLLAIAENSAGETLNAVPVSFIQPPVISSFVGPEIMRTDRPVRFSWETQHAIGGSLSGPSFSQLLGNEITSGHLWTVVPPVGDSVLTLNAFNTLSQSSSATIAVRVLPASTDFAEMEPNDTQPTANGTYYPAIGPTSYHGTLTPDDVDMYAFATGGGRLRAEIFGLDNCSAAAAIDVYEEDPSRDLFGLVTTFESPGCPFVDPRMQQDIASLRGNIVLALRATGIGFSEQPYSLEVTLDPFSCNDGIRDRYEHCDDGNNVPRDGCASCRLEGLDEVEPNDTVFESMLIELDMPYRAYLNDDDLDVYQFVIPEDREGPVQISLSPYAEPDCPHAVLAMVEASGQPRVDSPPGGCPQLFGPRMVLTAGVYYVQVYPGSGLSREVRGTYTLLVDAP